MKEIRIPKVGMSTREVEVTEIHVSPGDRVSAGDIVATCEADKVDLEIESQWDGVIDEVLVSVGDECLVSQVIATLID